MKKTSPMNILIRDLNLLRQSPREYLYSFTYPADEYVKIEAYDPGVTRLGQRLIERINKIHPALKTHLLGSAAYRISGQKDIDLIAESSPKNFKKYLTGLSQIFGEPLKKRRDFIEWHTTIENCTVELLLIDPAHPISAKTLKTHQQLLNDKELQKKYEKVKLSANGVSIREYKRRRLEFFNKVDKS